MNKTIHHCITIIHRHTGGLENEGDFHGLNSFIHRHTGGLENQLLT